MSKNRKKIAKRHAQKRAKQNAKARDRRKAYLTEKQARQSQFKLIREMYSGAASVPDIDEAEYLFWLCHGANFLVSDAENGVWSPLFEGIYEGRLPDEEHLAQGIIKHFSMDTEGTPSPEALAVLAWTVSDASAIRVYRFEALNRMKKKDPDCDAEAAIKKPGNAVVWDLMNQVRDRVLSQQRAQEAEGEE